MGVNWYGDHILDEADKAMERNLTEHAAKMVSEMQHQMQKPKHGRDYRETPGHSAQKLAEQAAAGLSGDPFDFASGMPEGKRKTFDYWRKRSSAPYEAPAVQQGGLYLSLQQEQIGKLTRKVGAFGRDDGGDPSYAIYLELGTSRMTERPYLRPALHKFTGRIGEELWTHLMP